MNVTELNFDGLVGPSHNYAGLSLGNVASASNAGASSRPRAAALQGLDKMRAMLALGLPQGFLPPHRRPAIGWLRALGFAGDDAAVIAAVWREDPALLANAASASVMWTANAATVSPAPDCADGRTHLSVANLAANAHRSIEAGQTEAVLATIFAAGDRFAVHAPVPAPFGDEGAANHMRLADRHGAAGLEIFVYGAMQRGAYPARQNRRASEAVARRHGLDPDRVWFAQQSDVAIQAGAFHNDVVAVANERVLFAHEHAFAEKGALYAWIEARLPQVALVEVSEAEVSLADAVASYLFNAQLVTTPAGETVLVAPAECAETPSVKAWLDAKVGAGRAIHAVRFVDLRESMRNGGGPACLRLRVPVPEADIARLDSRFLLDERGLDALAALVEARWPTEIKGGDLGDPALWRDVAAAHDALDAHLAGAAG